MQSKKLLLRKEINASLKNISKQYLKSAGEMIAHHIYHWFLSQSFKPGINIGIFLSMKNEIDTKPIIEIINSFKANVFLPDEIINNPLLKNFKVIFVPGLAFDLFGNRLGRGQGYYDKMLKPMEDLLPKPIFIALTLDEQIINEVPIDPHDVAMDYICTPKQGIFRTKKEIK